MLAARAVLPAGARAVRRRREWCTVVVMAPKPENCQVSIVFPRKLRDAAAAAAAADHRSLAALVRIAVNQYLTREAAQ